MFQITVIIPTFNRKQYLFHAINSVLAQTYKNIELIIIDDGSSDKTINLLKHYKSQLQIYRQKNKGVSAARNKGIKLSSNNWIAFLDSDDRWHPKKLENQINYLVKNSKYKICHTDEIWIRRGVRVNQHKKHKKYGGLIFDKCIDLCRISPSSVIIHKDVFNKVGLFNENLPVCEDYDLWLRITAKFPVLYLDEKLTIKYGGHLNQLSEKYWGMDRFRIIALESIIKKSFLSKKNKLKVKKIKQIKNFSTKFNANEIAPIIRGLLSNNKDQKFVVNYRLNKHLKYFMNGKNVRSYSSKGTATPDHVIRVKPFPLIITPKKNSSIDEFKVTAKKAFENYRKKYINYFNVNKNKVKEKKVMLDTSPRVVLVQNVGVFAVGKDLNAAKIAGDLTETNAKVIASVEETSTYKFIPEKDLFDVEYWSLEQAKIKKQKKLLEGNVVVITGSTGTIGFETYKMFKNYGAEVVLLDYNLERLKDLQSKIKDLCIHCDVRNKKSVKKAFNRICEKYGGIDILISNAGTATNGAIGEIDDNILRQSFEDNFFSHQNCASEAIKIMKKQNINGCLLFNISKQSVNPGKNFGPYGLPKSALLSLCKQYAVDYGSYGIRSNGVNADRIRSGLMNDKMIRTRAKARSIRADDYMRGNLLLNEVKAEDVAKAFFHLATSKKTTGAVLTVDGGNIAASLR